jgi:hypothetical protein
MIYTDDSILPELTEEEAREIAKLADAIKNKPPRTFGRYGSVRLPASTLEAITKIVETGYKTLARANHPDAGGSDAAMAQLNAGAKWLRDTIKKAGAN